MGGTPCKCATESSILGLGLWNSPLAILQYSLINFGINWQNLLLWPIRLPPFNYSYEGTRLLQQKMLHYCPHVLVQKPSPKSKPCTLPQICWLLISPCEVANVKEQIEKTSMRTQGGTTKTHFHTIAHRLRCEVVIFCLVLFARKSWFSSERQSLCFFFLLLISIWTEGWCQNILWKQHAGMLQKSCRPIIQILPGCCFFRTVLGGHLVVMWYILHIQWP